MKLPRLIFLAACMAIFLPPSGADRGGRGFVARSEKEASTGRTLLGESQCVCIFDFRGTLWVQNDGVDSAARDAQTAVAACKDNGYEIAVASGSSSIAAQEVLEQNFDGTIFNSGFFSSPAFQMGNLVISTALNAILDYYSVTDPGCALFFDNEALNKVFSLSTGVTHHPVDSTQGITMVDLAQASASIPQSCSCPAL